jgi:hypothetical protein
VPDGVEYELFRVRGRGDGETTVYVVQYPLATTRVAVVYFPETARLDQWCAETGVDEAIVGGFFLRDPYRPLGEVRISGELLAHEPVAQPWATTRACLHIDDGTIRMARRDAIPQLPAGDLLQAGPLLVAEGRSLIDGTDPEGFSAGAGQFDSDITDGAYPRCALGVSDDHLIAVCCDGRRSRVDAGLEMGELARLMVTLGANDAINLDGGGSATLVHRRHLLNRPYSNQDQPAPESRAVVTALVFDRTG